MKILIFLMNGAFLFTIAAFAENVQVVKFLSRLFEENSAKNILYLILDCDANNLKNAVQLFQTLELTFPKSDVNIITVPVREGVIKPFVFTKNVEQLIEAFRDDVVCVSDIEEESEQRSRDVFATIFNILPQMHQHDTVLLFTMFHGDENLSSLVIIDKLVQKEITVNILIPDGSILPSRYENLVNHTHGRILTYTLRESLSFQRKNTITSIDDQHQIQTVPRNYKIIVIKKSLEQDTRTRFHLPEGTFQIFLTLYGQIEKALLIPPSGIVISILPSYEQQQTHRSSLENQSINFRLPIRKINSSEVWTLSASGRRYNVTLMLFVEKSDTKAMISSDKSDLIDTSVEHTLEKSSTLKQANSNFGVVKRQDFMEPELLPDGQLNNVNGYNENVLGNQFFDNMPTLIDADLQSTFFVLPGEEARLIFNVKNNKFFPSRYFFQCFSPQHLTCFVRPSVANIGPGQVIPVTVFSRVEGTEGSSSILAFVAQDTDITHKRIYQYVGRQGSDTTRPDIDYEYNGNCYDADTGATCRRKRWSVDITARDSGSGLLGLWTENPGLVYSNEFIIGTRDYVIARYSASCCDPKVDVTATDLKGNTYTRTLNVEHQYLNWSEITVIVLGAILLIALIAALIFLVLRWRRKRNERSFLGN